MQVNRPQWPPRPIGKNAYVIKKPLTNSYFTILNKRNVPAVLVFTTKDKAQSTLATFHQIAQQNKQKMEIETVPVQFLVNTCSMSMLPIVVYSLSGAIWEMDMQADEFDLDDIRFYLENKYKYFD
jgi:hypothetical protein